MIFTATNGASFDLSGLYGRDIYALPTRDFAATLFRSNVNVPWDQITPESLREIKAYLCNNASLTTAGTSTTKKWRKKVNTFDLTAPVVLAN